MVCGEVNTTISARRLGRVSCRIVLFLFGNPPRRLRQTLVEALTAYGLPTAVVPSTSGVGGAASPNVLTVERWIRLSALARVTKLRPPILTFVKRPSLQCLKTVVLPEDFPV